MTKCPVCESACKAGATTCETCGSALTESETVKAVVAAAAVSKAKVGDDCQVCHSGKLKKSDGDGTLHCETCGSTPSVEAASNAPADGEGLESADQEDLSGSTHSRSGSVSAR